MDSFLIKSFKGGISDYEDKGIAGSFKYAKNIDIRKRRDTLSAGQALADDLATGTLNGRVRFIVPASDGSTYFFLESGRIYKRTPAGVYSLVYTDVDGGINGACEWSNNVGDTSYIGLQLQNYTERELLERDTLIQNRCLMLMLLCKRSNIS
jgi:hypothetical protein